MSPASGKAVRAISARAATGMANHAQGFWGALQQAVISQRLKAGGKIKIQESHVEDQAHRRSSPDSVRRSSSACPRRLPQRKRLPKKRISDGSADNDTFRWGAP